MYQNSKTLGNTCREAQISDKGLDFSFNKSQKALSKACRQLEATKTLKALCDSALLADIYPGTATWPLLKSMNGGLPDLDIRERNNSIQNY